MFSFGYGLTNKETEEKMKESEKAAWWLGAFFQKKTASTSGKTAPGFRHSDWRKDENIAISIQIPSDNLGSKRPNSIFHVKLKFLEIQIPSMMSIPSEKKVKIQSPCKRQNFK